MALPLVKDTLLSRLSVCADDIFTKLAYAVQDMPVAERTRWPREKMVTIRDVGHSSFLVDCHTLEPFAGNVLRFLKYLLCTAKILREGSIQLPPLIARMVATKSIVKFFPIYSRMGRLPLDSLYRQKLVLGSDGYD